MYKFHKDLKQKIQNKDKSKEEYYILNADFLNHIKMVYNYKGICEELVKYNYKNNSEFNIKILIKQIKQKGIINEIVPLDDMKIVPNIQKLYSKNHFVNFGIINIEIYHVIEEIKSYFNLTEKLNQIKFTFYFSPDFLYQGKDSIKIGAIDDDNIFDMHYFIDVDLYKSNIFGVLNELTGCKTMKEYFDKRNINIDKKEIHELITSYGTKQGKLINFKFGNKNKNQGHGQMKTNDNNVNVQKNNITSNINNSQNKPLRTRPNKSQIPNYSTDFQTVDLSYLDNFRIKSMKEINYVPMIGLQNIGQTCYMNAALQCFSNTKALTSYFLNYNKLDIIKNYTVINETNEPSLLVEYLKLIRHLWCDQPRSYYAPYEFKEKIGKIDPLFKNFEANDAKDFVNFMVMRMHDELNNVDNSLTKQNQLIEPKMPLDPYNQGQILQAYLYEFQLNFNSLISNCFYGTTQGEFECQNCKMKYYQMGQNVPLIKYNYQTFFFLNFPLDEVRKFILSNQMTYMKYASSGVNPNSAVNLMDCFSYYQKDEILDCYCDRCQLNNAKVISRTKLFVAPSYLIILLNRGKGIEFNIKILFPEEFDTTGIFMNPSGIFQLYGVVKHFGGNDSSGHFTAYCRSPIDNCWYFYNDATVTPVKEQDKYQIQENGLTYMLFYRAKN